MEVCYICCEPGADSRDHLIPDSFFAGSRPNNLITLRAHLRCHNNLNEEYVRALLVGMSEGTITANYLRGTKAERSLQRNRRLVGELTGSLVQVDLVSPTSGILLDSKPGIRLNKKRFYPLMNKIVRGLYGYHLRKLLPKDAKILWETDQTKLRRDLNAATSKFTKGIEYSGVFAYYFDTRSVNDHEQTAWLLQFYKDVVFFAMTET